LKKVLVTGAIIQEGEKFLISRRGPNEKSPGIWEFPGGKLEEGESLEECIKRELKEELSIDAVIGELYCSYTYKYPHVSYELYFYKIISFKGKPTKSVHDKFEWERLENFNKYDFLPGDDTVIEKLISDN
tara:strand:+ start:81 stop:470 length:390 start_codon:yes stop_codon:yes gene_type:complete